MSLETKSRAIVLHTTRQGDSSLVIHVLDEIAGRQSLFLRGVGKGRRTSAAAAFHPLAVLEVVTEATPRSSLLYLREFEPVLSLPGLRTDIRRSAVAQFVCEVLWRTLRTGDGDPELFTWLVECVAALETLPGEAAGGPGEPGVAGVANFALWWLVGYCARMGFRPEDNWTADEAAVFNIVSARFGPAFEGQEEALFSREESLLLHRLLTLPFDEAMALPLSAARRGAFSRRMLAYLSHHLGQSLEIRSLDVLHAVFAD
ncbi:MAG: DNA repair protein RecO [Bacteroidales bacterium]|nr:DNA repair protein RecO [Bacteroidales bacterium]